MTDQADALAGKLADVPKRHSVECRARGGDPCECFGYPDYDAMVVVATAHFAEEIAKVREELAKADRQVVIAREALDERTRQREVWKAKAANADFTADERADTIATLTAENERLKNVDCTPLCEPGQHTSACFKTIRAENERLKREGVVYQQSNFSVLESSDYRRLAEENERLKKLDAEFAVAMTEAMAENERLKGESASRRDVVIEMREQQRKEWVRAENAEARAEQAEQRYQNACEALRIETEEADALERKLDQAEATLARVREGLTREKIINAIDEAWDTPRDSDPREDAADAILALLAPEGKG